MSELAMSGAGARERKSLAPRAKSKQVNVLYESEEDEPVEPGDLRLLGILFLRQS